MLNAEQMAQQITTELEAAGFKPTTTTTAGMPMWKAISQGIINHIQAAADVEVTSGSSAGNYKVK